MKKDIIFPEMNGVWLAIARKPVEDQYHWHAYIINNNDYDLHHLLIVSKGYSDSRGPKKDTSVLRHSIELLMARSYAIIEPMDPAVFTLFNEFWVSFYHQGQIYDKKFIFTPESVREDHMITIDALELKGILHI